MEAVGAAGVGTAEGAWAAGAMEGWAAQVAVAERVGAAMGAAVVEGVAEGRLEGHLVVGARGK